MTRGELRTLVLSYLDDPDGGYFTSAQVNVWLNNAQKEVQKYIAQAFEGHFIKCVQTSTVVGQKEYALPSDFKRVHRLALVLSGTTAANESVRRLQKIARNQQDMLFNQQGSPTNYYFQGNYIVLVPAPDQVLTLRLYHEYLIADMASDSDSPDLPSQYHEMVALIAAIDGMIKDGRDASLLMAKRNEFEKMLKQDAEQRYADEARTITQTIDDDFDGYW